MRLDKYLSELGIGTRSEVKKYLKKGRVRIEDSIIKDGNLKIDPDNTKVYFEKQLLQYKKYVYYMLNKPKGVVSATKDNQHQTVIDLIEEQKRKNIFPVGRLDKDTEGLLLITDDGDFAHRLLSPKKKVPKIYYVIVDGLVTEVEAGLFAKGVKIEDGYITLPAVLEILESGETSKVQLTIYEGKFHQVKRMFEAVGMKVTYLKRISMGNLKLDNSLPLGAYRELTEQELECILP